jgi:L-lactate dehydrogenase complex protein LldG
LSNPTRDKILNNIRAALGDRKHLPVVYPHGHPPSESTHVGPPSASGEPVITDHVSRVTSHVSRFKAELEALSGQFFTLPADEVEEWLIALLRERGVGGVLSWDQDQLPVPGLLDALRAAQVDVTSSELPHEDAPRGAALSKWETVKVGLTGADAALAATGTLALRSGVGRSRLASLSVETHFAFITEDQFRESWEAWLADSGPQSAGAWVAGASSVSLISGPSRTADIEMTLTVGVHGPREVVVVLVTDAAKP